MATRALCLPIILQDMMKTILVIDDDDDFLDMLCIRLRSSGYIVIAASDGHSGMKAYFANKPALVITDIVMPEKEGIEVIMELQNQNPKPIIIAMSGGGRVKPDAYLPVAKQLGADSIMQKPFLTSELLTSITALFESR